MPIQAENFEVNGVPIPVADIQAREDIDTINQSLAYLNKGAISNFGDGAFGYITTSSTKIVLYVPACIPKNATTFTTTALSLWLRTSQGGYVGGSAGFNAFSYITNVTPVPNQGFIKIILTKSDSWGITNNTVIVGDIEITGTLS